MRSRHPLLLISVLLLVLAACGGGDEGSEAGSEPAAGSEGGDAAAVLPETLRICTDSPYQPFEFEEDGEFTGFDVELMNAISEELGLGAPQYQVTPFEGIQSGAALNADQCDVAASAMTITEERAENLAFSDPYFDADQSLLVPADADVTTLADLSGMTLGVQAATTGAAYAQENAPEDTTIREYPDAATLFTAVQSGEATAALQDLPVNGYFATQNEGFEIVETYTTGEQYGFAAAQGEEALIEEINAALATLREDGTYDEIYAEWFGEVPTSGSSAAPSEAASG